MKNLTTNEIRKIWLDFWKEKDHLLLSPKSLIPENDDSLLFINSGVSTLKKYLSGLETPPAKRIVNFQKSLRTNDIENVGKTARHHTMFEMLGNFSIGDYFKHDVITYAWEILTDDKYFGFEKDLLYITVHPSDIETYDRWIDLGVNKNHIVKTEENFWEIGKGPGGPNTEIFFDRGIKYDSRTVEELLKDDLENDRVIEIWNIVFSQYNCDPAIPREDYKELPQKNIDTGMGLERMACVIQEVETNFETDNFQKIMLEISKLTDKTYQEEKKTYRIIADHIRALVFAINDGIHPGNEGRGYVIRKILRRALKNAYINLNLQNEPFLYKLVDSVIEQMKEYYPELGNQQKELEDIIKKEEIQFLLTLKSGIKYFNDNIEQLNGKTIPGDIAFKLYDTYGFPYELTEEFAKDINFEVDTVKYEELLQEQKKRARNSRKNIISIMEQNEFLTNLNLNSEFVGYTDTKIASKIILITDLNKELLSANKDSEVYLVFSKTPFYATSGGQEKDLGQNEFFKVLDVIKLPQNIHLHRVQILKNIEKEMDVFLEIDLVRRKKISKNHSATHLLHYALEKVLGGDVHQAGSNQNSKRTRFDYTSLITPTNKDIEKIQSIVNELIANNYEVVTEELTLEEAKKLGAKALFEDKYGDVVRVVKMGPSIELCGGTHVRATGDINKFYILSEQSVGSGIRRIEAITGNTIIDYATNLNLKFSNEFQELNDKLLEKKIINLTKLEDLFRQLSKINTVLNYDNNENKKKINLLMELNKKNITLESSKKNNTLQKYVDEFIIRATGEPLQIKEQILGININSLKELADLLLVKLKSGIVILSLAEGKKITIVVKVSEDLSKKYHAGSIIKEELKPYKGKGGGKPTFAQGGGTIT